MVSLLRWLVFHIHEVLAGCCSLPGYHSRCCSFTVGADDVAVLESQSSAAVSVNVGVDGCARSMPIAFVALAHIPHVRGDLAVGADGCSSITVQGTGCCCSFPGYRSCAVVVDGCCSFNVGADGCARSIPIAGLL